MSATKKFPNSLKLAVISTNETLLSFEYDFFYLIQKLIDFKLEIQTPADKQLGMLRNGNWTGIIGMLQREEVDMGIGKLMVTYERSLTVDYCYPYLYGPTTFVTDKPEYTSSSYAVLYAFSFPVWIAVFASFIVVLLASYASARQKTGFQSLLLMMYGILMEKSMKSKCSKPSSKLLLFLWIGSTMFLTVAYKAVLLSFLSSPTLTGIRDISQLSKASESNSFKCSTYEGSINHAILQSSEDESWKKIAECLTRSNMFTADMDGFLGPTSYKKAFINLRSNLYSMKTKYYVSDDNFYTNMMAIAVRKSFCCKDRLDELIHKMFAAGIFDKFLRDEEFINSITNIHTRFDEQDRERKITLEDLSGAFILLIIGFIFSFIALTLELISNNHRLKS